MFKLILGLVISAAAGAVVTAGVRLIRRMVGSQDRLAWAPYAAVAGAALLALLGLGLLAGTSFTIIDADEVGHLQRVYGGFSMPPGQAENKTNTAFALRTACPLHAGVFGNQFFPTRPVRLAPYARLKVMARDVFEVFRQGPPQVGDALRMPRADS